MAGPRWQTDNYLRLEFSVWGVMYLSIPALVNGLADVLDDDPVSDPVEVELFD
jgi:hypothetical protein